MSYRLSSSTYTDVLQQLRILRRDLVAPSVATSKLLFWRYLQREGPMKIISTEKLKVFFAACWSIWGKSPNPWNFVDSPGEWCHIPPPPSPRKVLWQSVPIKHPPWMRMYFLFSNGRFPNCHVSELRGWNRHESESYFDGSIRPWTLQKYPKESTLPLPLSSTLPFFGILWCTVFWNEKIQVVEFFIELRLRTSMPAYSPFVQPPGSQRIEGGSRGLSDLTCRHFCASYSQHVNESVLGTMWEWNKIHCIRYMVCIYWIWFKHASNVYIM